MVYADIAADALEKSAGKGHVGTIGQKRVAGTAGAASKQHGAGYVQRLKACEQASCIAHANGGGYKGVTLLPGGSYGRQPAGRQLTVGICGDNQLSC